MLEDTIHALRVEGVGARWLEQCAVVPQGLHTDCAILFLLSLCPGLTPSVLIFFP